MDVIAVDTSGTGLESQAREIVEKLGGKWTRQGSMCCCPAHEDSDPSLSVRVGNRTLLFHCFAGCDSVEVIRAIRAKGVLSSGYVPSRPHQETKKASAEWLAGKAREIWDNARPLKGSPAERYLQERGIPGPYPELRYLARTPHGPKESLTFRPAMIAAVRDDKGLVAVQRTFLDIGSYTKAKDLPKPKMALGLLGSGSVRLGTPTDTLGLAEGIENARSASLEHGIPVWATLGNERFPLVTIPSSVTRLILLPDPDAGGRIADDLARTAHARPGLTIETLVSRFGDANEALLRSYKPA